jgi:hypothetical protein
MNAQAVPPELRERDEVVIRRELGLHEGRGITYVDEGWDSRVYIVNGGQAVFKCPRAPAVATQYRHEIAALQMLEGITTGVRTPQVRWIAHDLEYFGYVGIVGEPLSTVVGDLGPGHRTRMGVAIGRFLSALHCATLEATPTTTVEILLRADGEQAVVELIHHDLPDNQRPQHKAGWESFLSALGATASR